MQREHDERAKLIAEQTLDVLCEVRREVQIPVSDAQGMDLWLRRRHRPEALPEHLQLLDQLLPDDCILEVFIQAVGVTAFWDSHRKQYAWRHYLEQQRRADSKGGPVLPPLPLPFMWIISAGRPESLIAEYGFTQRPGLPSGIYQLAPGWRIGLIVINELPPGKPTLLLRLMGAVGSQRQALAELRALPADDPDLPALLRLVASLRHTLSRATNILPEDKEEFMTAAWADFELYEQRIRKESRNEGRKEGLCTAVLSLCQFLNIPLSPEQHASLQQMEVAALQRLHDHLLHHRCWPQ